ncbi:MAG: TonB-dependent receptor [Dechloromonas sp.]|nr:TonB-dependent receptor [Dechloromonas sp.]
MNPRLKPLAVILPLAFLSTVHAVEQTAPLGDVVVTATRQAQRSNEVLTDISVIDAAQIRAAGPNGTLNDLLVGQPGIEITRKGGLGTDSSIFIRGSNNNHALVLVDGLRLGSTTTGYPAWGFIPLEQVDRVEIIRGSCSALYGSDAIGGVIQIFTKRGEGPLRMFAETGFGSWNTQSQAAGFSGGTAGWRYNFQLSHKRSDAYSAINNPLNSSYNVDRDGYDVTSSSGGLAYTPAAGHEIGINYVYSDGWNRYDSSPKATDFKQAQTLYGVNLFSRNRLNSDWTSTIKIGQSADKSQQYANGNPTSQIESQQTQLQWQNDIALPIGTALLAAERVDQQVAGNVAYAVSTRYINSLLTGWHGNLGAHRGQVSLRRDENSQFGGKTTGTLAYGYQLSRDWRANAAYSTGFKAPTFNDLYWPGAGNPDLKPESSVNRELAVHYETERHHASATYYVNKISDLVAWAPNGIGLWFPANVAKAELTGWTLAYEGLFGDTRLTASLDLQDPRDIDNDKILRYRAQQIAKFGAAHNFGALTLGAELIASGKRYNDVANTQELGGYALLNINASYQVTRDWSVFARANNVFDKDYVQVANYATPGFNAFVGVRYTPQ